MGIWAQPYVEIECDECGHSNTFEMTEYATGLDYTFGYDEKELLREGGFIDDHGVILCDECSEFRKEEEGEDS